MHPLTANTREQRRAVILDLAKRPQCIRSEFEKILHPTVRSADKGDDMMHDTWSANVLEALIELAEDVAADVELSRRLVRDVSLTEAG
jgi:hypothetical protein